MMFFGKCDVTKEAGATEDKAAASMAAYKNRFAKTYARLTHLKLMLAVNLALSVSILFKLFA